MSIVGDRAIARLNRDWRGRDEPTDVLSFSQIERRGRAPKTIRPRDLSAGAMIGDIVISFDAAERDAKLYGIGLRKYLRRLMIHGLLHLTGYDHERSPREARRMFARQRRIEKRFAATQGSLAAKSR